MSLHVYNFTVEVNGATEDKTIQFASASEITVAAIKEKLKAPNETLLQVYLKEKDKYCPVKDEDDLAFITNGAVLRLSAPLSTPPTEPTKGHKKSLSIPIAIKEKSKKEKKPHKEKDKGSDREKEGHRGSKEHAKLKKKLSKSHTDSSESEATSPRKSMLAMMKKGRSFEISPQMLKEEDEPLADKKLANNRSKSHSPLPHKKLTRSALSFIRRKRKEKDDLKIPPLGPIFGQTLEKLMEIQRPHRPELDHPFLLDIMFELFEKSGGFEAAEVFRNPGSAAEVMKLKEEIDGGNYGFTISDAYCSANLIRQFLKELPEPLIEKHFYVDCIEVTSGDNAVQSIQVLPPVNKAVTTLLVKFLRRLTEPSHIDSTKMGVNNYIPLFLPFFFGKERFAEDDLTDPDLIVAKETKEQQFLKYLINYMEFTDMEDGDVPEPPPPF